MTGEAISVFQDSQNFNVAHPLEHKWTLWYDDGNMMKQNPELTWKQNLKQIYTFSSIEEFWATQKSLKSPSEIPASANYHLFKVGIEPMWEDKENQKGGKWTFTHPKQRRGPELDKLWLDTIISVMAEQFSDSKEINGCVISIRKSADRISIWTKSSDNKELLLKIGYFMN